MNNNLRKFDDLLCEIESKSKEIYYNIDGDSRYKELCEVVTALDQGEMIETAEGDKLLKRWFLELIKCLFPDFDRIIRIIRILSSI